MSISIPSQFEAIPANYFLAVHLFANGTETYACNATSVWNFADAHADLFDNRDRNGKRFGVHDTLEVPDANGGYASFISDRDKSALTGTVKIIAPRTENLSVNNLAQVQAEVASETGKGDFSGVKRFLRLNANGLSPTRACKDKETEVIPYTAEYLFYKEKIDTVPSDAVSAAVSGFAFTVLALLL